VKETFGEAALEKIEKKRKRKFKLPFRKKKKDDEAGSELQQIKYLSPPKIGIISQAKSLDANKFE